MLEAVTVRAERLQILGPIVLVVPVQMMNVHLRPVLRNEAADRADSPFRPSVATKRPRPALLRLARFAQRMVVKLAAFVTVLGNRFQATQ